MQYQDIHEGIFIKRNNRFIAEIEINGNVEVVHVKNTGRCEELLIKGATVYVQYVDKPSRKTKYSLISVVKNGMLFNIDSQVPNKVIEEAINKNMINELMNVQKLKREQTFNHSRFDFYFEKNGQKGFIEVKGVTLEKNRLAMFPDAPTKRGTRHINELIDAKKEGYEAYIIFLLQFEIADIFQPNRITDPTFSQALMKAEKEGVNILVYNSFVTKNSIEINTTVPKRIQSITNEVPQEEE